MNNNLKLLKLMQLSSPTLPVGAFAYSQGLESAIENGHINNRETLTTWLKDSLIFSLKNVDLPLFARFYDCWEKDDQQGVSEWNKNLFALRETRELREEDHQLGLALARLLDDLGIKQATLLRKENKLCFFNIVYAGGIEMGN